MTIQGRLYSSRVYTCHTAPFLPLYLSSRPRSQRKTSSPTSHCSLSSFPHRQNTECAVLAVVAKQCPSYSESESVTLKTQLYTSYSAMLQYGKQVPLNWKLVCLCSVFQITCCVKPFGNFPVTPCYILMFINIFTVALNTFYLSGSELKNKKNH